MKRIHKILITLGFSLVLFFIPVTGQKEMSVNATGIPTLDVSNLLQNILGYLQDADVAGLFDSMSDHAINLEKWMQKAEDIQNYIDFMADVAQGTMYGLEIYNASARIVNESSALAECAIYFASSNCPVSIALAAAEIRNDFDRTSARILRDAKRDYSFAEKTNGDVLKKMESISDIARDVQREIYSLSLRCRYSMYKLSRTEALLRNAMENGDVQQLAFI
jgi:hypothetical protein